jgi:hypothetical protein
MRDGMLGSFTLSYGKRRIPLSEGLLGDGPRSLIGHLTVYHLLSTLQSDRTRPVNDKIIRFIYVKLLWR